MESPARRSPRWHRLLLGVPFLWQVALVPVVNDVAVRVWSLPFPMVWQMAGILVTTLVLAAVLRLDRRCDDDAADADAMSPRQADLH